MRKAEVSVKGLKVLVDAAKRDASSTTLNPQESLDRLTAIREGETRVAEAEARGKEEPYLVTADLPPVA